MCVCVTFQNKNPFLPGNASLYLTGFCEYSQHYIYAGLILNCKYYNRH